MAGPVQGAVGTLLEAYPCLEEGRRVLGACVEEGASSWGCSLEVGRRGTGGEGGQGACRM